MPSSRFTDGNSPTVDGGERVDDVKVDISDNELLEFLKSNSKDDHA